MDDLRQERLFAENPDRISPPEPRLYLGTSGWSYADWEGTLYPEGLPAGSRLAEYTKHYATVEDRKSTRLNSSHANISYAVFCLKKHNIINFLRGDIVLVFFL